MDHCQFGLPITGISKRNQPHHILTMDPRHERVLQKRIDMISRHVCCSSGDGSTVSRFNVAVLGGAGGIGQPLCLLLKQSPACCRYMKELRVYDVANTAGVVADLSHINTDVCVSSHTGPDALSGALYGADLVIIPAGVPRKPGMTRDDLFKINAGIVKTLVEGVVACCPRAWIAIISNPVNSTVPIASGVCKQAGVYNDRRLFGVTTLDVIRANAFVGQALGINPMRVSVPVIGGHAGQTILPLLSGCVPQLGPEISLQDRKALVTRIQNAGTEVVEAKAGTGSATLSMAYAAKEFATSCLKAMAGEQDIIECAYVSSTLYKDVPFFSSPVRLGRDGVVEFVGGEMMKRMTPVEKDALEAMLPELVQSIQKGTDFIYHQQK